MSQKRKVKFEQGSSLDFLAQEVDITRQYVTLADELKDDVEISDTSFQSTQPFDPILSKVNKIALRRSSIETPDRRTRYERRR